MVKISELEKMSEAEQAAYFAKLSQRWSPDTRKLAGIKSSKAVGPDHATIGKARKEVDALLADKYPGVTVGHLNRWKAEGSAFPTYIRLGKDGKPTKETWQWKGRGSPAKPEWITKGKEGEDYQRKIIVTEQHA